jgi:transcriptional regulator with XRE-family HTH domain
MIDGNKIRGARSAKRLTQQEVADLAKVSINAVKRAELLPGEARGSADDLAKIAKVLDLDLSDVIVADSHPETAGASL